jgi:hypothetical protein
MGMARDPKIINFLSAPGSTNKVNPERFSTLPASLIALRKDAVEFIKARLTALFDNADDSLFEMADRAGNNTDQTLFFEAMRALRLQRHGITTRCCQHFVREMEALNGLAAVPPVRPELNFAVDSLALVQPDELEETVALDSMVGRVIGRNKQALTYLAIRLNSLVKAPVDEQNNPLGPAMLAQIFVDALSDMTLDIKVRLIVLKLFERYVFNSVDSFIEAANTQLINAGVLPDLKASSPVRRQQPTSGFLGRSAESTPSGHESDDQQRVLSLFSELIGNWRHASGDSALSRVSGSSLAPLHSNELLDVLAQLPVEEMSGNGSIRQDLRIHINQLLRARRDHQGHQRSLDRIDEDVISLVSMLFDFILDDPQLPAALKAMIGRLQLPILRLAIADKRFFGQSSHPARRLLNELARATMGWNDQDDLRRDQLHVLLESIVQRLLAEADPQPELFSVMHGELTSFVKVERRRSDLLEQRTRDAEEGKARIDAARVQVATSLNRMLMGRTLPVFVVDLLRDTWSQVMQMTCLREGPDSPAVLAAENTAQQLLDSVEQLGQGDAVQREALNLAVREALADGFSLLGMHAQQGAPLLVRLKQLQQVMLQGVEPVADIDKSVSLQAESQADERQELPSVEAGEALDWTQAKMPISDASVSSKEMGPPLKPAEGVPMPVVEIREPILREGNAFAEQSSAAPDAHASAWVEQLHTGSWFELQINTQALPQRCKLAAIISFSGKYIFVNRGGMKVAEYSAVELARHHTQSLIRLLNDNQLFDRALESVIGNLRQLQAGKNP